MRFVPLQSGANTQVHVNVDLIASVSGIQNTGSGAHLPFTFTLCTADGKSFACSYATEREAQAALLAIVNPAKSEDPPL